MNKKEKIHCNQCRNCAVENTAVLDCADDTCSCHSPAPAHREGKEWEPWEKDLGKLLEDIDLYRHVNYEQGEKLRNFIKSLLSQQHATLREKVEGLRKNLLIEKNRLGNCNEHCHETGGYDALLYNISRVWRVCHRPVIF